MIYAYMLENTSDVVEIDNTPLIKVIREVSIHEDEVYVDAIDDTHREELKQLIQRVQGGDTVIVRSLSDIANSRKGLDNILTFFHDNSVDLVSVCEDYYSYERYYSAVMDFTKIILYWQEQKRLWGIEKAKKEKRMGRKKDKEKIDMALRLYDSEQFSIAEILKISGISSSTLYREKSKRAKGG